MAQHDGRAARPTLESDAERRRKFSIRMAPPLLCVQSQAATRTHTKLLLLFLLLPIVTRTARLHHIVTNLDIIALHLVTKR
jgi:hypothetical protein